MKVRGVNKAIIVGNLGQDPEKRVSANGSTITTISVATTESWKDKQTGEQKSETEWHRIVFFNRLAEIAGDYLKKGSQVYVEGKLRTRKWQDNEGKDRYTTEIISNEMQMLGAKNNTNSMDEFVKVAPKPMQVFAKSAGVVSDMPFDDDVPF